MPAKPIPDNYPGVTPYLAIEGAAAAIDFYKKAHVWSIATHVEDVSEEELKKRAAKLAGGD
jgi:hypothetical protein